MIVRDTVEFPSDITYYEDQWKAATEPLYNILHKPRMLLEQKCTYLELLEHINNDILERQKKLPKFTEVYLTIP